MTRNDDPATLDRMFDTLSHPLRRRVLMFAYRNATRDDGLPVERIEIEGDDVEQLANELHHIHLPKLDDGGYIEWDRDSNSIRRGPAFDDVESLLRLMDDNQDELLEEWL